MKKNMAMSIGCLVMAGMLGCCNIFTRVEGEFAPYACAPHPYYCTAEVWPDVALSRTYLCGTVAALAVEVWPISVFDEVFEVALDTVFLPVDLTGMCCRTDEQRKKLAEVHELRKTIAEEHERRMKGADVASCCPIQVIQQPPEAEPTIQIQPVGNSAEGADSAPHAEVDLAASAETVPAPKPANKQGVEP
jgi:hypothetical protein